MINALLQFGISAAVIVWAGSSLTNSAAVIAKKTGIGTVWAGALLLPLATSLPELVTTLRASLIDAPDLAAGNLFGSCLYNLALLAFIDYMQGKEPLTARVSSSHTLTASLSVIAVVLALLGMQGLYANSFGRVGFETPLIALLYILGSRLLYLQEKEAGVGAGETLTPTGTSGVKDTRKAVLRFCFAAALIVAAGVFITDAADKLAVLTGLSHGFIGSVFLAISTSLPETVTTLTAVKLGYLDMAVANVFGANFMNMLILFPADLLYRSGPLLSAAAGVHRLSALAIILFSAVVVIGLNYKPKRNIGRVGVDTFIVLAGYFLVAYMVFNASGN